MHLIQYISYIWYIELIVNIEKDSKDKIIYNCNQIQLFRVMVNKIIRIRIKEVMISIQKLLMVFINNRYIEEQIEPIVSQ